MRVLWNRGRATVAEVVDAIGAREPEHAPAYNTVQTLLKILERKGYVSHVKDRRAFVFSPAVDGFQARRRALAHVLSRFFDNSRELLVQDLLGHDHPDDEERRQIRELLARADRGEGEAVRSPAAATAPKKARR